MPPSLRFLGHNCFLVETETSCVLIDPWLSSTGAFYGSWFQYPANHHLSTTAVEALGSANSMIVLSHEHGDHFDREFLGSLPKGLRIAIAKFDDPYLGDQLRGMGFSVEEVAEGASARCGDLSVQFFAVDTGTSSDAAILVEGEDFRFLNQNDCKMFDRLDEVPSPLTHYAVQYSGASWYPECFEFGEEERRARSAANVANKISNVSRALRALQPPVFVPSAGPVVLPFLPDGFGSPEASVFAHQDRLVDALDVPEQTSVCFARPGDLISPDCRPDPIPPPSASEINWYREHCVDTWSTLPNQLDPAELIEAIRARLRGVEGLAPADTPVIEFRWGDGEHDQCLIDLHAGTVTSHCDLAAERTLITVSAEPRYFNLLVANSRWQEVVLSLRARVHQSRDVFDNWVNLFLYSDTATIQADFENAQEVPTDRFDVSTDQGVAYSVDRWCPHQGADLTKSAVEGSCLVCPRHGWRFDLEDEGRDARSGASIRAVRIAESDTAR